jgi:hypothetical protein
MVIMIVIIITGIASRTTVIDAILRPIVTEAQRRRSVYNLDRARGPLTGLRIDMGADRPPAIIGQGLSGDLEDARHKFKGTPRRPGTPAKRRPASALSPNFRAMPSIDYLGTAARPRASLSRPNNHRRLARSAHLHAIDPDRRRPTPEEMAYDVARDYSIT